GGAMSVLEEITRTCAPLLAEIGERNHVRVTVHRAGKSRAWTPEEVVGESHPTVLMPELVRMDSLRLLAGKPAMFLAEALRVTGGELVSVTANLRTNGGKDYGADSLGNNTRRPNVAQYGAGSNNTDAANAANTAQNTTTTQICWGTPAAA